MDYSDGQLGNGDVGGAGALRGAIGKTIDSVDVQREYGVEVLVIRAGGQLYRISPLAVLTRHGARANNNMPIASSLELVCRRRPNR